MEQGSIAIVGSGVIGLSVACELAEQTRKRIDVFAPQPIEDTTSATAAAYWAPYWIGTYPKQWAAETLSEMQRLADAGTSGVHFAEFEEWLTDEGHEELQGELARDDVDAAYWWRDFPGIDFRIESFDPPVTRRVPPLGDVTFTRRVRFRTVVARMTDYLGYLQDRATASGRVALIREWVDDLAPLADRYEHVFHCTGWGAKRLCDHDPATRQMRLLAGMVCRVDNTRLSTAMSLHRAPFHQTPLYIIPRHGSQSDVICGGTAIELDYTPDPRQPVQAPQPEKWNEIIERCRLVEPRLTAEDRHETLCGLRPVRSSVRVEVDPGQPNLIHCYGHGGSGLTLSWGSARAAVALSS